MHFSPVDEVDPDSLMQATEWFMPKENAVSSLLPQTLSELLSEYMEREHSQKLGALGYRRYRNSPVRWHKLVGDPGNELLLSMVFVVRYNEIEPMYGAQSLYCPLTLSDKYYPLHDDEEYWIEARFEYSWKFGRERNPLYDASGPIPITYSLDLEKLPEFIDDLILPELDAVRSLSDCHAFFLKSRNGSYTTAGSKVRFWIEAALAGDELEAQHWYEKTKEAIEKSTVRFGRTYDDLECGMIKAYEAGGCKAMISYLLATVYQENLRKLKRAGIIE